jgi:hypothetical protein
MKYTEPRYTKDLDVWVEDSATNAVRLYHALAKFGAPLTHDGVTPDTFTEKKVVYQIGVAPVRIDVSTHIDGVMFDAAWQNRIQGSMFGVPVYFISLSDLITNKQASGRSADLDHLKLIEGETKRKA